jgi:redox-sensitive bicupin YhaK (pirin superfamily)
MVEPHFAMLWSDRIPVVTSRDEAGRSTRITVVAGRLGDATPPSPPPHSWAARPESDLAIWTLVMEPGARFTLPPARPGTNRVLYLFRGAGVVVDGTEVPNERAAVLRPDAEVSLENRAEPAELLLLQGQPIGEPVVQHGPFVMNTAGEIQQAIVEYQRTGFGGWPWPSDAPVHPRTEGRFARHADGRLERGGDSRG